MMSFTGRKADSGGDFESPKPGLINGVCCRIVDWGTQEWGQFGPKRRVQLVFKVAQRGADGKELLASKMYTLSFSPKANLMKDLESWRGRPYGETEEIDLLKVIGRPCMLNISARNDSERTDITSISQLPEGMTPMVLEDGEALVFNLDAPDWDAFNRLHEKTQEKILATPEGKAAMSGTSAAEEQRAAPPRREMTTEANAPAADFDDEIPF